VWLLAIVGLGATAIAVGGQTQDVYTVPGTSAQRADEVLEQRFPEQAGDDAIVVFAAHHGTVTAPPVASAIAATQGRLERLKDTTGVTGPATPGAGALFVSPSKTIAFAQVQYSRDADQLPASTFTELQAATAPAKEAGLQVEFGDAVADQFAQQKTENVELIGLGVAVVILLLAFGSVIAMGLPIGTALGALAVGVSGIYLLAAVTPVGSVTPTLATMIGLGVGIDYSLFILTRHRQNLAQGMSVLDSIALANATAGQAVLFAGGTVVIAICAIAVAGIPYVTVLGLVTAGVVLVMMTAAVTLIPALLALAGTHINRAAVPRPRRHAGQHAPHHRLSGAASPGWERWARFVSRHRWPAVLLSLAVLLTLAVPLLSMRLGQIDDGSAPRNTTQRKAYDLIAKGFGPGVNGPLLVVVQLPRAGDAATVNAIAGAVGRVPGLRVAPPQLSKSGTAAVIFTVPPSAPQSAATERLVDQLRTRVLPAATSGTGASADVGGATALFIDLSQRISSRLPLFIGLVLVLSFLLLMMVFRSVLVPLKAAVMNLLSIGAAFGVIVAVFQWGWLKGVIGLEETIPIVSYVPMMTFAILFGLSMDYEVFLLSRIREHYYETHDNLDSVVQGLAATARVITAAALIMISVFLGFVGSPEPTVKMFGVGLAVAVAVDATIVRLVLVPATMELLGDANWWLPTWLDRVLPRIHIEEEVESPSGAVSWHAAPDRRDATGLVTTASREAPPRR
jgi:RND superfamily putative drug exporter